MTLKRPVNLYKFDGKCSFINMRKELWKIFGTMYLFKNEYFPSKVSSKKECSRVTLSCIHATILKNEGRAGTWYGGTYCNLNYPPWIKYLGLPVDYNELNNSTEDKILYEYYIQQFISEHNTYNFDLLFWSISISR